MSIKPRKSEVKKLVQVLDQEHESMEDAAEALLIKAYELYEGQAKFWVVGQVRPEGGWLSPDEGMRSKVILGPFGTVKQAESAGNSLAYSHRTGEEARWWVVEGWYGTPASWYDMRKKQKDSAENRATFMELNPRQARTAMIREWHEQHPGAPLR